MRSLHVFGIAAIVFVALGCFSRADAAPLNLTHPDSWETSSSILPQATSHDRRFDFGLQVAERDLYGPRFLPPGSMDPAEELRGRFGFWADPSTFVGLNLARSISLRDRLFQRGRVMAGERATRKRYRHIIFGLNYRR